MLTETLIKHNIKLQPPPLGLYLHIPFCRHICHYCDFAKTANYTSVIKQAYFEKLVEHLNFWKNLDFLSQQKFSSVFFGGGTPSLFTREYELLFDVFSDYLADQCEVSIEVNPEDINQNSLEFWHKLGVNRLSIGIQSFTEKGLAFLTRKHGPNQSIEKIKLAQQVFKNLNVDLIYGWPSQTERDWQYDLDMVAQLNIPHLSLYNLTYEPQTVIGRRKVRGIIKAQSDYKLATFYQLACDNLGADGYQHEEISNWSRQDFSCRHNWLYWQNKPFLGVGAGAHGFLHTESNIGYRYAYPRSIRNFLSLEASQQLVDLLEIERNEHHFLIESISTQIRTCDGVDIKSLEQQLPCRFIPNQIIEMGVTTKKITFENDHLTLSESEWFREQAWALAAIDSFE